VVSVTDPYERNLGFLDRKQIHILPLYFFLPFFLFVLGPLACFSPQLTLETLKYFWILGMKDRFIKRPMSA
jgi:hypothetical protein